jgi:PPOX class probable F420-dependent enzyme
MTAPDTAPLARAKYVSLTTFRRDGTPVSTPVWNVAHRDDTGDGFACTTGANSGKVKRLRNDDRIEVAPCDVRGRVAPDAPHYAGTARVVDPGEEFGRIERAVMRRYKLFGPLLVVSGKLYALFRPGEDAAVVWHVSERKGPDQ